MPVGCFFRANGEDFTKGFPAPKRATLRSWYKAARDAIGRDIVPEWEEKFATAADVSVSVIIFKGEGWDLFISRKKGGTF